MHPTVLEEDVVATLHRIFPHLPSATYCNMALLLALTVFLAQLLVSILLDMVADYAVFAPRQATVFTT